MGQCCSERDQGSIAKIVEEEKVKLGESAKQAVMTGEQESEVAQAA